MNLHPTVRITAPVEFRPGSRLIVDEFGHVEMVGVHTSPRTLWQRIVAVFKGD